MNRKIVLNDLKICTGTGCSGCSYEYYATANSHSDCRELLMDEVKELLKEQEPRRVKVANVYGQIFYFCPRCALPLKKSAAFGKPRYCEDCGQELIW